MPPLADEELGTEELLGVVAVVTVIVPEQVAVWLLPPQLAIAETVCVPAARALLIFGVQVMFEVTAVLPQVNCGFVGACVVVTVWVTEPQVSLGLTVSVPEHVAVWPLQSPVVAVA